MLGPILIAPSAARAVDAFEIQVYDGTVDEPGSAGLELHANSVISGVRAAVPPELPAHGQSHFTLEPAIGITDWWEAGIYVQTALLPDGSFAYAGSKLRTKFVVPPRVESRFRWGVNLEVSRLPEQYDRNTWGAEIRPIVTWTSPGGAVYTSVNPIVDVSLARRERSQAPDFEPAATICHVIEGLLSVGLEYYASLGPLGSWQPLAEQQHYLFEVINVLRWKRVELSIGAGEGLTQTSNSFAPRRSSASGRASRSRAKRGSTAP